ncbi:MAG TPA: hypothetical protein VIL20_10575 [Sandaracinaceae bacterium]
MSRGPVILLAAALATGCAAASESGARLELGTGTIRFEPVEDGATLPLIRGAQGGWHVWIAVRAEGLESDGGMLSIEHQPADESAPPVAATLGVRFDPPDAEGRRSYLGWPAILADPSCAVGELLRVRATLTTPDGMQLADERHVLVGPGEHPPPPCTR